MTQTFLLSGLCLVSLFGCADVRVPAYQRPEAPAKSNWSRPPATTVSADQVISPTWWQQFGDPYLDSLVAKAVTGNFDLKMLAARIEVANAQIGEARAGALPSVDIATATGLGKTTGMGQPFLKQYGLSSQVSWYLDIWGAVAKGVQAERAEFRATEADWRAGYLTIVADVSTTYFQIVQLDEQIEQQQRALAKNEQILAIYETMHSNGLIADTELLRQRAENNRLTKDLLELRRSRDVTQNALATLLGVPAGELKVKPAQPLARVKVPAVPAGLPLDLLTRRPDVVAAEFRVLEAHDLMGQARLAQLPSVSLTGLAGTASFALSDLFKAFTLGLIPSIDLPAFNPGIAARARTSEAQVKVAEEGYRSKVIAAFEEVENALVNLEAHKQQKEQLQKQVDQLRLVSDQTKAQLKIGLVSQLDVFENERSLLTAQLALLASHEQVLSDTVTLYKALGGGWAQTPVEVVNARH